MPAAFELVFRPERSERIAASQWTINVMAAGPVHAWLDRNNGGLGHWVGPTAQAGAGLTTLGSPSGATRPLTVGSVASATGGPSAFSGCGPLRAPGAARKPDLVAVGENVTAPLGVPADRRNHILPSLAYTPFPQGGTSFAAPQVAGACALLFEHFGPAATWADIRQSILRATVRKPEMPEPDLAGWDGACGYGLLDVAALLAPSAPVGADLWLPKTPGDTGTEPFVAWTFWDSPALVLEDSAGQSLDPAAVASGEATPARLRVRVANRGATSARDVIVAAWWAPLGAAHPLPRPEVGGGAWQATGIGSERRAGNLQRVEEVAPGEFVEQAFDWVPPRDPEGRVLPHLLLATAGAEGDPYDPKDTVCAQNNAAMLGIAAARGGAPMELQILGSEDTDGLILWCDNPNARFRVENIPVTALPWRDAAMFQTSKRRDRPLYGAPNASGDMAVRLSAQLEGPEAVAEITDVLGAERLALQGGRVTIDAHTRLTLPRLRIANGTPLVIRVVVLDDGGGAFHMLHLSGGRRVGGGTVQISA